MFKTLVLAGLLLCPGLLFAGKAGIGAWENPTKSTLNRIATTPEIGWDYTSPRSDPARGAPGRSVEFVPMIHGRAEEGKRIVSDLPITALLGFNEPDQRSAAGGSKLSVEEALALWPRLERRGLRVDFIAVHYYLTDGDVAQFERWLRAVHAAYRRPIWVTEFAYIDRRRPQAASYGANAEFAERAMRMMERLPFVERHAWFAANPYDWNGTRPKINLVTDEMRPTPLGEVFARVLRALGSSRLAAE